LSDAAARLGAVDAEGADAEGAAGAEPPVELLHAPTRRLATASPTILRIRCPPAMRVGEPARYPPWEAVRSEGSRIGSKRAGGVDDVVIQ
jgi:hypothetical protein